MAQEYTIDKVSPKVDEWQGQYGPMKTYYVKFVDGDKAVQVNKKPDSQPPKAGDVLYGSVATNQHGTRFKAEKKPFSGGGYKADPDKQNQIKAQWAIGQAVNYAQQSPENTLDNIESLAKQFFLMVDRVKAATPVNPTQSQATSSTTPAGNFRNTTDKEPVVTDFNEQEPINLDDIPF